MVSLAELNLDVKSLHFYLLIIPYTLYNSKYLYKIFFNHFAATKPKTIWIAITHVYAIFFLVREAPN